LVTEVSLVAAALWCCGGYTSLKGSVEPIVREVKKYYIKSRRIRMPYVQKIKVRITGLVTSYVGTAF
jgi:hypothetical protein